MRPPRALPGVLPGCPWAWHLALALVVWCVLSPHQAWAASPHKLALLIGHNSAGGRVASLQFAEADARKVRDVLLQMAGYTKPHIWLLLGPTTPKVLSAMAAIRKKIKQLQRSSSRPVQLLVYYSGHARRGKFLLGKTDLSFRQVRAFLKSSKASLKLAIFDACETGGLTRLKGLKRRKRPKGPLHLRITPTTQGEVIITATGERENAHEDPQLKGGIFTHYLVSGLRGAADRDRNGRVTLQELYRYSYTRTLERTIMSAHGPQRAHFRKQLAGVGQLVLASLKRPKAWLTLERQIAGSFYVWNKRRDTLLAEVSKHRGRAATIALSPGRYALQWRRRGSLYATEIVLRKGQRMKLRRLGRRVAYAYDLGRRGQASEPVNGSDVKEKNWDFFDGQMEGVSLDVQYRVGYSGVDTGLLHHGPSVGLAIPIDAILDGQVALQMRLTYQLGAAAPSEQLNYQLHLFHLDLGLVGTLLQRRSIWLGLGGRLRASPLFQHIPANANRAADDIVSFSFGCGGFFSSQFHVGGRWFVHAELDAGFRMLQLAETWYPRWTLALGVGVGRRF